MPYDLFISYAHLDNARHQVRELRDAILEDFEGFAGRSLKIFFDEEDIPGMSAWESRIARGLRESRLFLAVLSPNYFDSEYCRKEWDEYIRYEAMRQCLGEGVAPVYFIELPGLESNKLDARIKDWVAETREGRQWFDFASQSPIQLKPWHDVGKRALEDSHVAERLQSLKSELDERLGRADRARQSPSNIYRHNPEFVGRVRELSLLREALDEKGSVGVVGHSAAQDTAAITVHGLGGMGKTELALAYSHAFAWDYPGGRWLAACEHVSDFNLVLRQLAGPLEVEFTDEEQKDAQIAGERILRELRKRDRSLLLLDNVTDPALITPDVLQRLPAQGHVHVLATTRMGPMQLAGGPHDHSFIAVDELPSDDALALIRSHQPEARFIHEDDEAAARELVELLDGFTLAVETAAIYLGRHAGSGIIANYARRLRTEMLDWSEQAAADPAVGVRHKVALLEHTLAITFESLSAEQLHVLSLGALLPADQIPLPWIRAIEVEGVPSFEVGEEGDIGWDELCESLRSLRLLQPDDNENVTRMHRMVQELLKKKLDERLTLLDEAMVEHVKSRAEFLWEGWVHHEHRWEVTPLVACAWHWMERGECVGTFLANKAIGPLQELARFSEAELMMRRALEIDEASYGPDHPYVATDFNNLAQVLEATDRLDEAEPLMRRALEIDEASNGQGHVNVARDLNNLALLLQATNRLEEAEPMMRRALEIDEANYGSDHPSIAVCLSNLAELLKATNRLEEAEPMMRRALGIHEANYGPDHPRVATDLNNLVQVLQATNRLDEAEPMMRRALDIDKASYGPDHPQVAIGLNNLARLLQDTSRLDEAEPMMLRALEINEASYGPDHPNVGWCLNNLARLLQFTNRLDDAEPIMCRSVKIYLVFAKRMRHQHSHLQTVLRNYAGLLQALGKRETEINQILNDLLGEYGMSLGG
jgi:tetratricopeptide (TPR) repeat protein